MARCKLKSETHNSSKYLNSDNVPVINIFTNFNRIENKSITKYEQVKYLNVYQK